MANTNGDTTLARSTGPVSIGQRKMTGLIITVAFAVLFSAALYFVSRENYLLFHGFVEAFSLVIAFATFAIAWNSRRIVQSGYFLFIGISFLAVALVDLVHTLAYEGMGVFPNSSPDLATQLWIASRYLLAVSLLIAPVTVGRKINLPLIISGFIIAEVLIFTSIFYGFFPTAYIEGTGLTPFKVASEYIIAFLLLGAIGMLLLKRRSLSPDFVKMMAAAIAVMVVSEIAFIHYYDVYGIANMIGHLLKVASYFLVYKALVEMTLVKPYDSLFHELKRSELSLAKQTEDLTSANTRLVQEVAERKRAELEIGRQEKRYHDALDGMLEGCQIIDFNWQYIYVNDTAGIQGHLTKEDLVGHTMMEVYPGIETTDLFSQLRQCMENRVPVRMENEFKYPDGITAWFELSIQPVPEGIFILSLDITERKQSEKIKDEFIGMVSHELKNPLTVIIGALSTASDETIPESEIRPLLQDASAEADELASIIDNLLELSRQQASRLVLQTEPVDIGASLRSVSRKLESKLAQHRLLLDLPTDLPPVRADRVRVERILYNLVDNAVKYSPGGGEVAVTARIVEGQVVVQVTDHGIGISPEDRSRLFQSFERLVVPSSGIKGTGLGLRVCRILVEAHGGRIWVESTPNQGSTFFFTLPISIPN